ncbi:MAG TPA: phosphotransferase [Streptosporangiaceae bacterium]|nr:phosphotransferase [Streptosporangiaceae bacterium]
MSARAASGGLVGQGRNADVYDLGGGRVLRRYRDAALVTDREAEVMVHARACGVPVPEVFDASGPDLVMEYVVGPTMLQAVARQPWTMGRQARLLAQLHDQVHAVPALSWQDAPIGDGDALLHTDLHPDNVILTQDGPRVIDWEGAVRGPAPADVALTWVIVATSEVPGPLLQRLVGVAGQRLFARLFLVGAPPLAPGWIPAMARHRLSDHNLRESEAAALRRLLESRRWAD